MAKAKAKQKEATKEKTKVEVIVKAFTKAIAVIKKWKEAAATVTNLFDELGQTVKEEAAKNGYDEKQTREAVFLSLEDAYEQTDMDEKERATFRTRYMPEVAKILRMAFPKTPKAEAEVEAAREYNEDASLHERIGANDLLEIARGNKTFAAVRDRKQAKKKAKKEGYTLELFSSSVATELDKGLKAKLDLTKMEKAMARLVAQRAKAIDAAVVETEGEEEEK